MSTETKLCSPGILEGQCGEPCTAAVLIILVFSGYGASISTAVMHTHQFKTLLKYNFVTWLDFNSINTLFFKICF